MGFSLSGRETWVGAFLIVDHFPSPSASTRRVFRWLLPRAGPVDRRDFQSDILLWYGRNCQRTETSSPSLLAASLKVKRNNAHGWAPGPDRPNIHSNRVPAAPKPLKYVCFLGLQDNPEGIRINGPRRARSRLTL